MIDRASVTYSVSTLRQPVPPEPPPERGAVLDLVVGCVVDLPASRLRVGIDGHSASGKTSFGHELARAVARRGRPAYRASLDDFKRPWAERYRYDRETGEGYYRNAFDDDAVRRLLLEPASASGDGVVALCCIDPLTQVDHSATTTTIPPGGVLIVDGVFAFRPELDDCWDLRIWLDVDPEESIRRGVERDAEMDGGAAASETLHRDRYLASELVYLREVDPRSRAQVIVDNNDVRRPRVVRRDR
ncbi:MAG: uridine kinase [Acidimicrobiia bacterium]